MALRFYLDENLPVEIARQLRSRGIDAVTVRDLGQLGDDDLNHLHRATALNRVLCTYDTDFIRLAVAGTPHAGIVLGHPEQHHIGPWVAFLELMDAIVSGEEMRNRVEYL